MPRLSQNGEFINLYLDDSWKKTDIRDYMQIYIDDTGQITIDKIIELKDSFQNFSYRSLPAQPGVNHWFRFSVINYSSNTQWLLEHNYFRSNVFLEFYIPTVEGNYIKKIDNPFVPHGKKDIKYRNPAFLFNLENTTPKDFYIKISCRKITYLEFNIWRFSSFNENARTEQFFHGIFSGIIIIIMLYNLILFFSLKDHSYLYYVLFIFFLLLLQLNNHGLLSEIWGLLQPIDRDITSLTKTGAFIFFIFFTKKYLCVKKNTVLHTLMISLTILSAVCWGLAFFLSFFNIINTIIMLVGGGTALVSVVIKLKVRYTPAFYYLIAVLSIIVSGILIILPGQMTLPISFLFYYIMDFSTIIMITLFALGLAHRIKMIRLEKEAAQQEKYATLDRMNKLKDEILANTSHEIRNPLNGIIGLTESLLEGSSGNLPSEAIKRLKIIVASGKRLYRLVDDLLKLTMIKNNVLDLEIKNVDITAVIKQAIMLVKPKVDKKQIKLHNQIGKNLPQVKADEDRIFQVIDNILRNAVKFTPKGFIRITSKILNQNIYISFEDSGIGISREQQSSIFNAFEQGDGSDKRNYDGLGLGLAIARQLIEMQGGTIRVSSEPGQGSCFTISLPLADYQEKFLSRRQEFLKRKYIEIDDVDIIIPERMQDRNAMNILIVDDDPVNLQVLIDQLSSKNYCVHSARNGEDALQIVFNNPAVDLVLLDVMMPGMSGYDVCRKIREKYNLYEKPVLMLTAKNILPDVITAFECGANDYLLKPFNKTELLSRIQSLCNLRRMTKTNKVLKSANSLKEQLMNIAAHDLRNPLNVVKNYANRLRRKFELEETANNYLDLIINSSEQMLILIKEFLEKNRIEDGTLVVAFEKIDFLDIVKNQINILCEIAREKQQKIQFKYDKESTYVIAGDQILLTRIIDNLLSNAIKYSYPKSTIKVNLELLHHSDNKFSVSLTVKDQGPGLTEDDKKKIFTGYYKLSATPTGNEISTGLGLMICKALIHRHGGTIEVQSEEGKGAAFTVTFPGISPL